METKSFKMNRLFVLAVALMTISVNAWGSTLAYWEKCALTENTGVTATTGTGTMTSNVDLNTEGTYCYSNSGIGKQAEIILSNLSLSGTHITLSFVARSSQSYTITVSTSTDGTNYTELGSTSTLVKKELPYFFSNIPAATQYIKIHYNYGSGAFYFGSVKIANKAESYTFNLLTSENTSGWTGSNWDGTYLIVYGNNALSGYAPGENSFYPITITNNQITINDLDQAFTVEYVAENQFAIKGIGLNRYLTPASNSVTSTTTTYYNSAITYNDIVGSETHLKWNTSKFGYYASSGSAISLYKKQADCTETLGTPSVTATPGNASATLTWNNVANGDTYTVTCAGATIGTVTGTTTKTCQLTGLTNGTPYTWKVKANAHGIYCESSEASGTVTPSANCTVTWKVDGETYTTGSPTTSVAPGGKVSTLPTAPATPTSCGDAVFMGWTDHEVTNGSVPSPLFKTAATAPVVNADVTYHAVFADEE